jgi:hypothetical protein
MDVHSYVASKKYTDGKYGEVTSQLADKVKKGDLVYNVKDLGVKGDNATDDAAAIQSIVNTAITTGGIVYFPRGTYKISSTIVINTSNIGKKLTIKGAGLGATTFIVTADVDAFKVNGYLVKLSNFEISGMTGTTKSGILISETGSSGRIEVEYVQAKNFQDGLTHLSTFDQVWIHKCFFSSNSRYGIYFNQSVAGGGALLDITHCITNWNGSHGVHITTSNIYGHITLRHHESVANAGRGISIVGGGTYNLLGVTLEQPDVEYVQSTADAGIYLKNVKKFNIIGGQVNIQSGMTVNAAIQLDACTTGFIMNPWLRNTGDGFGTPTNYIYCTGGTSKIYLIGGTYFGTPFDFTVDGSTDKSQLINLDTITTNVKKYFYPASSLSSAQGTPSLTKTNDTSVWLMNQTGSDAISLPILNNMKVKKLKVYWFNNGTGTGNVAFQIGYRKVTAGSSVIANSRTYDNQIITTAAQNILTVTTITPSDTNLIGDMVSLWLIRNSASDTLANQIGVVGVELDVE